MANEYATLAELKDARRITDTNDDAALSRALTRASRAIDRRTGRRFYLDTTTSARTFFTAERVLYGRCGQEIIVDDIGSTSGLAVAVGDGTTWTAVTDYSLLPSNAIARGRPVTALRRDWSCWDGSDQVQVTARWGWPSIPDDIAEATYLLANRRFMRRDSPEGVSGWSSEGPFRVSRFDPDIEDLIGPFVLPGLA